MEAALKTAKYVTSTPSPFPASFHLHACRANSGHRVWQTLPRHLRRRAASHDVRRVPARLRNKARAEVVCNHSLKTVHSLSRHRWTPQRRKARHRNHRVRARRNGLAGPIHSPGGKVRAPAIPLAALISSRGQDLVGNTHLACKTHAYAKSMGVPTCKKFPIPFIPSLN